MTEGLFIDRLVGAIGIAGEACHTVLNGTQWTKQYLQVDISICWSESDRNWTMASDFLAPGPFT
jgi:hypothetical protein